MTEPKELHPGDPCPACGGELKPATHDTASDEQRAELGDLHACTSCRYKTRFKADAERA